MTKQKTYWALQDQDGLVTWIEASEVNVPILFGSKKRLDYFLKHSGIECSRPNCNCRVNKPVKVKITITN